MTAGDLERCTVQLWNGDLLLGTGFFAGPGLVVTCAHVVGYRQTVTLVDFHRASLTGTVIQKEEQQAINGILFPDIALIEVEALNQQSAEVEEGFNPDDMLHAWGFPESSHGSSIEGVCEGPHAFGPADGQRLIKLRSTQLTPGFSGAPVLNLRTGKVCGMLKRSRDETMPVGGYAIRAAQLLALPRIGQAQRILETPLRTQLRAHLQDLAEECGRLPRYFPGRLKGFDQIRQRVRTIVDRNRFYQEAEERERPAPPASSRSTATIRIGRARRRRTCTNARIRLRRARRSSIGRRPEPRRDSESLLCSAIPVLAKAGCCAMRHGVRRRAACGNYRKSTLTNCASLF